MIAGQRFIPSRARREVMRSMRASSDAAWDRGRDDRLAGRPPSNPYQAGSPNAETYGAAYRLTKPRARPVSPARAGGLLKSPAAVAGALCNLPEFQAWAGCDSPEAAAVFVRNVCQVRSRAELNVNAAAAHIFEYQIRRLFAASRES